MKTKVLILMSTYNGKKYLKEQLESLYNQNDAIIDILIRDDGSKDGTIELIKKEQESHLNIKLIEGNNIGYAKSFWELVLKASEDYDYFAFCDQDDIWLPNKIKSAIDKINESKKNIPILYTSRVVSINNSKEIIDNNTFSTNGVINIFESFQKSIVPGCTFVFNKNAIRYLKKYKGFMESHDWATYCIINTFGKVLYDNNSYIHYRIHDNNAIGHNSELNNIIMKIKRFFLKSKCTRSRFAKDFYDTFNMMISNKELKKTIKEIGYYQINFKYKINLIFNKNIKGIIFKIYVLLNKV